MGKLKKVPAKSSQDERNIALPGEGGGEGWDGAGGSRSDTPSHLDFSPSPPQEVTAPVSGQETHREVLKRLTEGAVQCLVGWLVGWLVGGG